MQSQTFNFVNFGSDRGLQDIYVYHLSQAPNGYLYLTTGEGLYRYDGHSFEELSNKKGKDNFMTVHLVDASGTVWIGHHQHGLSYIKGGQLSSLRHPDLEGAKVTDLMQDRNGNIWVASNGAGLFFVDSTFKMFRVDCPELQNLNSIIPGPDHSLIAATATGCYHVKIKQSKKQVRARAELLGSEQYVKKICAAEDPELFWMLAEDNVISSWHYKSTHFEKGREIKEELETENELSTIYVDHYGNLWIGEIGVGVKRISFSDPPDKGNLWINSFGEKNGLKAKHVQCIYQDAEDNIWLGSFGEGLIQKTAEKFSFFGSREGLSQINCRKLSAGASGELWIASKRHITRFKPSGGVIASYELPGTDSEELINALLYAQDGTLWVASNKHLYQFDVLTARFNNFSKSRKLGTVNFTSLIIDSSQLIAGSMDGIYYFPLNEDSYSLVTTNEGLLHNNVINLYRDSQNRLWVCSHGTPPYYIKNQKVEAFKNLSGYNSFKVNAVTEDRDKNIWIATEGDGLFRLKGTTFERFTTEQGLHSNYCSGVASDANASLWTMHADGLSELKKGNLVFSSFSSKSGLLDSEFNPNALCVIKQEVWFGSDKGLVLYKSNEKMNAQSAPPVSITGLSFNNKPVAFSSPVEMAFDFYLVRFDFIAVSLNRTGNLVYKYRLPEIDSNWRFTSSRYVEIPHLGDGQYTFEVSACFNNQQELCNSKVSRLSFSIQKPVWKKPWFYVLVTIVLVCVTFIIIDLRTRQLRKMQMLLQLKVKQKTFLLQREKEAVEKIKGELEHRNKDMTDSIHYARNIQLAILPPEETMEELFGEDFFVLFKPKDIVSGDIYWAAALNVNNNNKNNLSLAAVIDCTGHGVPGAFLSIMANDVLKQSIIDRDVNNTNEILDFLNHEVTSHLNPTGHRERLKDGMDVALVGIDRQQKKLFYSGANNPAYVLRQTNKEVEVVVLKPTKQAIGSVSEDVLKFERQEFDLQKGDTVYLFSDGYADQFGGERNKKFTYKRFRDVLCKASLLPFSEQKDYLLSQLLAWKMDGEQTDDVCVMGIRV